VGPYILDFYCPELKLAIEIQGGVHQDVLRSDYDAERRTFLESEGIHVLYFENRALLETPEFAVNVIRSAVLEQRR
jgi:very-short-patch-repair endonuclease